MKIDEQNTTAMRKITYWVALVIFVLGFQLNSQAWNDPTKSKPQTAKPTNGIRKASCAPATAQTQLQLNNVRALIETGGSMWQDRATGSAAYEIPKASGQTAIYSGALWMGGKDINGQLKIAAVMFRQGNDFWTGPLTNTGAAEVDPSTCLEYDRHYEVTRIEVEQFAAQYLCGFCDPGYTIPQIIMEWPAHGDVSLGQDFYLAPFYDNPDAPNGANGTYDPLNDGDYPWYDIEDDIECQSEDRTVTLKGDHTIWWVFNDKGNIHTETGGDFIGMEIRAQAFSFATNDEINSMTFYNYEMINQGTQTLFDTYFGQFVDPDLGGSDDDYVGCDVARGLGYCYNGDAFDGDLNGAIGYGSNPPAIGVDFFEGPYQDNDNRDNGLFNDVQLALADDGIVYPGIGLGYGDTVVDNERYGMRNFIYWNRDGNSQTNDPGNGQEFYNYMTGFWRDGTQMLYGGVGHTSGPTSGIPADYMFPGDSDPLNWGTQGVDPGAGFTPWTEQTANNPIGDRRFMQSAGPFTLEPGAVNNLTVGVVYGRGTSGDPFSSVEALRLADDKAQLLFESCFLLVEGPDAPELAMQEMSRELIITISNPGGNNKNEDFASVDPTIPRDNTYTVSNFVADPNNPGLFIDSSYQQTDTYDRWYRFQGYQVFQLQDATVGPDELDNDDRARLVYQSDIKDSIGQLINYEFDQLIGASQAHEMVDGADEGLTHSFKITDDRFAFGDRTLINHKKYYFMAVAYGYNNYKAYDPEDATLLDGQKKPYLASRKAWDGSQIKTFVGIPHIPSPEAGGTIANSQYGSSPQIIRIEGQGNGFRVLDLTSASESELMTSPYKIDHPIYQQGQGPIDVKVIDPLNVVGDNFTLRFIEGSDAEAMQEAEWVLINETTGVSTYSDRTLRVGNEQLLPEYGISITIGQSVFKNIEGSYNHAEMLDATMVFADSSQRWLTGVPDLDGEIDQNWIRSGTVEAYTTTNPSGSTHPSQPVSQSVFKDGNGDYSSILGGTWAPYTLCAAEGTPLIPGTVIEGEPAYDATTQGFVKLSDMQSVDVVFTNDESKWTRCPVIEMQENPVLAKDNVEHFHLRSDPSVGKSGAPDGSGTTGMGWFPGYAVNLETGERLNMAFGENSWLAGENGRDMLWNPTSRMYTITGQSLFGGMHYIYVFSNERDDSGDLGKMPHYDEGAFCYEKMSGNATPGDFRRVYRAAMWVGIPLAAEGEIFRATDVRVRLRVNRPYDTYAVNGENVTYPQYEFSLDNLATEVDDQSAAEDAMDLINIVPNPYYAYSNYETNRLDNRVKVTNLPQVCTVRIYTIGGTLIRTFTKDNAITSLDWDLKNQASVPIAGGVYIIHIDVPGVGEKVIKWFGALRPVDLENF